MIKGESITGCANAYTMKEKCAWGARYEKLERESRDLGRPFDEFLYSLQFLFRRIDHLSSLGHFVICDVIIKAL
jgi:hypothetical protein